MSALVTGNRYLLRGVEGTSGPLRLTCLGLGSTRPPHGPRDTSRPILLCRLSLTWRNVHDPRVRVPRPLPLLPSWTLPLTDGTKDAPPRRKVLDHIIPVPGSHGSGSRKSLRRDQNSLSPSQKTLTSLSRSPGISWRRTPFWSTSRREETSSP